VRQGAQDSRLFITTDNTKANIDTSSVIPLAEADGTLKVSLSPIGANQIGKALGSTEPSAGSNTVIYTVPASTTAQISLLSVCNKNAAVKAKIRLGFAAAGGSTPGDGEWVYYGLELDPGATLVLDAAQGVWLAATSTIVGWSDVSNISFYVSGLEYS
jgi:hypothetical protein